MGRRKNIILENVLIEDIGAEGKAIARVDNMVVFVPMLVPGDVVDIRVTRKRKNYMEGVPLAFHKYSDKRIDAFCEHFGVCGGCKWQHLPYELQLAFKEKQTADTLLRIGKINDCNVSPIIPSEKTIYYRNKLEYTFSSNKWFTREEIDSGKSFENTKAAGFHVPGMFDRVVDITKCWLQEGIGNDIRNFTREYAREKKLSFYDTRNHGGFLRNLIIRNTSSNEYMAIFSFGEHNTAEIEGLLHAVNTRFPALTSLLYTVNTKLNDTLYDQKILTYAGKDYITEQLDDLYFRIGPKSFFQTNTAQALIMYKLVKEFAGLNGKQHVYDLYTGTGTIANFIARESATVTGIESVPEAIEDAKLNSSLNGIENTRFFTGDMKELLTADFIEKNGRPDIIITDPPRAGMHEGVVRSILLAGPDRIVYVSCNPSTQARDIALMSGDYRVTRIQPLDMFPHTHHLECIVLLEKNENKGS